MAAKARRGDEPARLWVRHFRTLAELLGVRVEA
jgi:hypothetical protein